MKLKSSTEKKNKIYSEIDQGNITLQLAIKLLRRSIGKNQIEYAKLAKISTRILRDFEQGNGNPTLDTMNKIFKPFGVEIYLRRIRR